MDYEPRIKLRKKITPVNCKLILITQNDADIPLTNHSKVQGTFYNLLSQVNPKIMYQYHKSTLVKPWSFSYLRFYFKQPRSEKRGFTHIRRGQRGYINIKTIDSDIHELIKKYVNERESLEIGSLKLIIERVEFEHGNLNKVPQSIDTITVKLETPTFFYNARKRTLDKFTAETFLNYQCEKFKQLGIVNLEAEELYPYLRIVQDYTQKRRGYISNMIDKNKVISLEGQVGNITFKIVGNSFERTLMWKLVYLSEFTGIGIRTSLGFGYNSIISIK